MNRLSEPLCFASNRKLRFVDFVRSQIPNLRPPQHASRFLPETSAASPQQALRAGTAPDTRRIRATSTANRPRGGRNLTAIAGGVASSIRLKRTRVVNVGCGHKEESPF